MGTGGDDLHETLEATTLFGRLPLRQLHSLANIAERRIVLEGVDVITEGDEPDYVYALIAGEAEVIKTEDGIEHRLAILGPPDCFGEIAMIDSGPRSASVRARTNLELLALPIEALQGAIADDPYFAQAMMLSLKGVTRTIRETNHRLMQTMHAAVVEAAARADMARLTVAVVVCLCFYTLLLGALQKSTNLVSSYTFINVVLTGLFVGAILYVMLSSEQPIERFGLTLRGWRRSLAESVGFTAVGLAILTAVKWLALQWVPAFEGMPLFEFEGSVVRADLRGTAEGVAVWRKTMIFYVLFIAPAQELIVRGGLQSALRMFLAGRQAPLIAILLSNLIFGTTHLIFPLPVVGIVFLVGLYWGWLYHRHGTLLGVSISHIMIGLYTFWFLGIDIVR